MGTNGRDEDVAWAECVPSNVTGDFTCTFTNEVVGWSEIQGVFEFDVNAALATTEKQVEFNLNGTAGLVDLPGENGGIDSGIVLPGEVTKAGAMNSNNWSMTWTIDIPGASLVAAGKNIAHITDTLARATYSATRPGRPCKRYTATTFTM